MAANYTIDGGKAGKQRLDVLAGVMHESTTALLERVGAGSASRCLDVGCGGGHVSRLLASLVGSGGYVVGVDLDPSVLELARADAQAAGLANIEFRQSDASDIDGPYDLAYARFLLSHVSDAAGVVGAMVSAVRSGGRIVVEDIDFMGSFCSPPSPAYERYVELYRATVSRRGGDADIGPRLPGMLHEAGLQDVAVSVVQPCGLSGDAKVISPVTLERIADSVLAEGIADAEELGQVIAELYEYEANPATIMSLPRVVQAWARVP